MNLGVPSPAPKPDGPAPDLAAVAHATEESVESIVLKALTAQQAEKLVILAVSAAAKIDNEVNETPDKTTCPFTGEAMRAHAFSFAAGMLFSHGEHEIGGRLVDYPCITICTWKRVGLSNPYIPPAMILQPLLPEVYERKGQEWQAQVEGAARKILLINCTDAESRGIELYTVARNLLLANMFKKFELILHAMMGPKARAETLHRIFHEGQYCVLGDEVRKYLDANLSRLMAGVSAKDSSRVIARRATSILDLDVEPTDEIVKLALKSEDRWGEAFGMIGRKLLERVSEDRDAHEMNPIEEFSSYDELENALRLRTKAVLDATAADVALLQFSKEIFDFASMQEASGEEDERVEDESGDTPEHDLHSSGAVLDMEAEPSVNMTSQKWLQFGAYFRTELIRAKFHLLYARNCWLAPNEQAALGAVNQAIIEINNAEVPQGKIKEVVQLERIQELVEELSAIGIEDGDATVLYKKLIDGALRVEVDDRTVAAVSALAHSLATGINLECARMFIDRLNDYPWYQMKLLCQVAAAEIEGGDARAEREALMRGRALLDKTPLRPVAGDTANSSEVELRFSDGYWKAITRVRFAEKALLLKKEDLALQVLEPVMDEAALISPVERNRLMYHLSIILSEHLTENSSYVS